MNIAEQQTSSNALGQAVKLVLTDTGRAAGARHTCHATRVVVGLFNSVEKLPEDRTRGQTRGRGIHASFGQN